MNEIIENDNTNPIYNTSQYTTTYLEDMINHRYTTLYSILTTYKKLPLHFCVKYFLNPNNDYNHEGVKYPISIYDVLRYQPHLKATDVISCYYNIFGAPISRL
jgi:hypothetical protein